MSKFGIALGPRPRNREGGHGRPSILCFCAFLWLVLARLVTSFKDLAQLHARFMKL